MSGVFALIDKTGEQDLAAAEARARAFHLHGSAPQVIECARRGRFLLGRYHLGVFPQHPIRRDEETGTLMVASGYRVGEYPVVMDAERDCSGLGAATLRFIGHSLHKEAFDALARLDGAFQFVCLHEQRGRLLVLGDRYGLQPLYWYEDSHTVAFAPDLSLLIILTGHLPEIDRTALAEYFALGFVPGRRTLFSHVSVFPPASVGDFVKGKLSVRRYWRPVFAEGDEGFGAGAADEILAEEIQRSVRHRAALAKPCAVSLSGGIDSRLLLAALVEQGLPVSAYTFGPEDSPDHPIGAQVAGLLGVPHFPFIDTPAAMRQILETGVRKTGGMCNVIDFTGMAHLPEIARHAPLVINGYGGNELLGFLAFDLLRAAIFRRRGYLAGWLADKLNPGWSTPERGGIYAALAGDSPPIAQRLEEIIADYPVQHPVSLVYHFFLEEKARRANLLGVMADTLHLEPVVPFYANGIVDLALTIPPRERMLALFYRRFVTRHYPQVSAVAYSRTGLPVTASILRIGLRKVRRRKRRRDPDAPWDRWLRSELREYLQDHLLTGRPRIHDLIEPGLVTRVVTDFLAGKPRRVRPVGQLLTCELWLRGNTPG